jgi:hypothetical protein
MFSDREVLYSHSHAFCKNSGEIHRLFLQSRLKSLQWVPGVEQNIYKFGLSNPTACFCYQGFRMFSQPDLNINISVRCRQCKEGMLVGRCVRYKLSLTFRYNFFTKSLKVFCKILMVLSLNQKSIVSHSRNIK